MPITFKQLRTLKELAPCERLQEAVWKFNKDDIIPSRFMLVLCKHGGFAMGAFDGDSMIGFLFGVPAIHYGRPSQHSHMMAVLPEYRDQNIGFKLKIAQREDALNRNIGPYNMDIRPAAIQECTPEYKQVRCHCL